MVKYKIRVYATLEFELESESDYDINGDASDYVENNKNELDWYFDEIINQETGKNV